MSKQNQAQVDFLEIKTILVAESPLINGVSISISKGCRQSATINLQIHEILVLLERGFDSIKLHPNAGNLFLQCEHARRDEPSHTERLALLLGEAGAAVLERVLDHS